MWKESVLRTRKNWQCCLLSLLWFTAQGFKGWTAYFSVKEGGSDRSCWSKHIWQSWVCLHFHIWLSRQLDMPHTWHYVKGTARWSQQHGDAFQSQAPGTGDRSTGPMYVTSKNTIKTEYWLSRMSSLLWLLLPWAQNVEILSEKAHLRCLG